MLTGPSYTTGSGLPSANMQIRGRSSGVRSNRFRSGCVLCLGVGCLFLHQVLIQGYLAHKKQRPPRTLQKDSA